MEAKPISDDVARNVDNSLTNTSQTGSTAQEVSRRILDIIFEYALNKFDDSKERLERGAGNFMSIIDKFVASETRIQTCLPAFPFKSANKVYKVLGSLPDKAEELALDRLNTMCVRIQEVYAPGAEVTIISDGITYNDLLCISDQDTWAYGEALRNMATEKKFNYINFARMKDLLDFPAPEKMTEIIYVANCTTFRRLLLNQYGRADLDIDHEIATNPDTKLTYLGYKRFLESDLKYIFPRGVTRTANEYKRECKYLAKQMLLRGDLWICLLNTKTGYTTPWHCSVARLADGEWISAPMAEFSKDDRLELIYEGGRPSYFKEKPLQHGGLNIDETSASYLQEARPRSAIEYFSEASTPTLVSPPAASHSNSPVSSPRAIMPSSASSASETSSPQSLSSSFQDIVAEDGSKIAPLSGDFEPAEVPYGRRLLPQIIDQVAVVEPERIVFSLATLSGDSLNFNHISARMFSKAIDKTAWWLNSLVGKPDSVQPVGYIGPHDLRYVLLTYACVKVGYAALFLSPKNNLEGALAVLESVNCNIWVNAAEVPLISLVNDILEKRPMKLLQLPEVNELLSIGTVKPFPYTKTFEEAINEPFCYLHTSGSTGVPKPIPWSHGLIGTMDAVRLLPPAEGYDDLLPWTSDWKPGDTIYSSFPMSHGAGIIMDILMPALFDLRCILGPRGVLPNVNLVETLAESAKIDIWSMVPSLVDELGETPEVLSKLSRSKFICASGGPVSPITAGKVNDTIRVLNLTGTTEGLFIGNLVTSREDWFWFCFHPYSGFEFKEIEENTYEHWVHRNEHWPLFQGIFHTFPEKESINFKDLYVRHPTKPNLWSFKGRSDDLVVLSNGYKITPLETEAFIATHPAIESCLIFGTGKPQAGLLIELKDPSIKTDELIGSIWETVKKANSISRHKDQLLRDFVTFSDPNVPFIRTDKGTVKRSATLALYADYIERFYSSRNDDICYGFPFDMDSVESVQSGIREILASSLPTARTASPDTNLFDLGLDSLGVFAAIRAIRAASGLGEQIAPRHVYANPSIANLASAILRLVAEEKSAIEANRFEKTTESDVAQLKDTIAKHKARQSFRLNAFDYVNPNHGMGLVFYFSLHKGVRYDQVFANLQEGLNRTFDLIPALSGKIMNSSEQEIGYTRGNLCVTIPPDSMAASVRNRLVYKDLSNILPSFDELRDAGFPPSAFKDGLANFVSGGCILAVDLNHCCLDGVGAMIAIKAWAENCRYLQGNEAATCQWYDPESFNHSLPEIIHQQEGWDRPLHEIDPSTWRYLPFFPPDDDKSHTGILATEETAKMGKDDNLLPTHGSKETVLSPQLNFTLHPIWPLPRAERTLKTTLFLIPPEKLEKLKQDSLPDAKVKGVTCSISDIVQAFFWRSAIKARYGVATEIRKETFGPDDISILELPTDGRPYFSSLLPSTYMGSLLILNRSSMSVETLCSPKTSIGDVAYLLRQSAKSITPSILHDAFSILQWLPDHTRFSTANMGLEHMHAMISNMMLFQTSEICFGDQFFANGGSPESMRPQLERGNGRFRFLVIFPMKQDGGVELVMGTHPEELEMLMNDEEFTKYATLHVNLLNNTGSHYNHDGLVVDNDDESSIPSDIDSDIADFEAVTVPWNTSALVLAYVVIWLTYFVEGILSATTGILIPYVTSTFAQHSFTPAVGILSSVIGGVTNLTLAKILDIFGRAHGLLFCIIIATSGLAMMIFQTIGNNGILYSLTVFVADTSSMRNRGLVQAIVSSPNLITSWLSGPISSRFMNGPGWRWAFGLFSILVPSITLPLFFLLLSHLNIKTMGMTQRSESESDSGRSLLRTFLHYFRQFDAIGLILLSTGVALLLVSLNLYALQDWNSMYAIALSITGSLFISLFVVWERYYATITFVSYSIFLDRTALGACILSSALFISFWFVNNLILCSIAPVCLYVGVPLSLLGLISMSFYGNTESGVGYIVVSQIFISVAAGVIMVCDEVAILAAAPNHDAAVCLAVLGLFGNIGGAIGLTIASTVWQNIFRGKLMEFVPIEELPNLSYPIDTQGKLLAIAMAVWAGGFMAVVMWRNINVVNINQGRSYK
ncbi:transferase family protein [Trichoderma camerunense]